MCILHLGTLPDLIAMANTTFQSAWLTWQEVTRRFAVLQSVNNVFLLTEASGKFQFFKELTR